MAQAVKIQKIEPLTHNVLQIILDRPEGISYKPGQACDVSINKDGWRDEVHPFTFVSLEENGEIIEFNIKTYPERNGVTNKLCSLEPGDELLIGDVFGAIQYKGEGMFLAGGAGVTPFVAIFNMLERDNKVGHNTLLFGNKTENDIILKDKFKNVVGDNFINVLSEESAEGYEHGYIDADLIKKYDKDDLKYYYVCGPEPMVESVVNDLKSIGIKEDQIVTEE